MKLANTYELSIIMSSCNVVNRISENLQGYSLIYVCSIIHVFVLCQASNVPSPIPKKYFICLSPKRGSSPCRGLFMLGVHQWIFN